MEGGMLDDVAVRVVNRCATPEGQPILETNPVRMGDEGGEQTGVSAVDVVDPARRFEHLAGIQAAPGAGGNEQEQIGPIQPEQIGR